MKWISENFKQFSELVFLVIILLVLFWAMWQQNKDIILQILIVALALFKGESPDNKKIK